MQSEVFRQETLKSNVNLTVASKIVCIESARTENNVHVTTKLGLERPNDLV